MHTYVCNDNIMYLQLIFLHFCTILGWCWPGSSSYLDFFDPQVRKYYSERYLLDNFQGTTNDVHIWNDMNEPSVSFSLTCHCFCFYIINNCLNL